MLQGFLAGLGWTLGIGWGLFIIAYCVSLAIMAANKTSNKR